MPIPAPAPALPVVGEKDSAAAMRLATIAAAKAMAQVFQSFRIAMDASPRVGVLRLAGSTTAAQFGQFIGFPPR